MKKVSNKIIYIVFAVSFPFETAFTATQAIPTTQQHAISICSQGSNYINRTNITNNSERKTRFLTHVIEQHMGLNSNSYATYQSVGSLNKVLRSEFILADNVSIGNITVSSLRTSVEISALHKYLLEILVFKQADSKSFKDHMRTLSNFNMSLLHNNQVPDSLKNKKIQELQIAIDSLNIPQVWTKLIAISTALLNKSQNIRDITAQQTYQTLNTDIVQLYPFIKNAATGGNNTLSSSSNSQRVQILDNIKSKTEKLIQLQTSTTISISYNNTIISQIANEILAYALNLPNKTSNVNGNKIDILCHKQEAPLPSCYVIRMVSQIPWYNPQAASMTAIEQRPNANIILVGFLRYEATGTIEKCNFDEGNLDYTTMYPTTS